MTSTNNQYQLMPRWNTIVQLSAQRLYMHNEQKRSNRKTGRFWERSLVSEEKKRWTQKITQGITHMHWKIISFIKKDFVLYSHKMNGPVILTNWIFTYFHDKKTKSSLVHRGGKGSTRNRHYTPLHPRLWNSKEVFSSKRKLGTPQGLQEK